MDTVFKTLEIPTTPQDWKTDARVFGEYHRLASRDPHFRGKSLVLPHHSFTCFEQAEMFLQDYCTPTGPAVAVLAFMQAQPHDQAMIVGAYRVKRD